MRKIILFSLMTIMLTGVAFGDASKRLNSPGEDECKNAGRTNPKGCLIDLSDEGIVAKHVGFCTAKTDLDNECRTSITDGLGENFCKGGNLVLVGMASPRGEFQQNANLSIKRVEAVGEFLKSQFNIYSKYAAGDVNAKSDGVDDNDNQLKFRAVEMYCIMTPDQQQILENKYNLTLNLNFDTTINVSADADVLLIEKAKKIDEIIADLGAANKWRTEEGKFNTARLMTDLGAGVVLGTVGGVVTSVLMKKKQVEDGFENLKCTVGGQVVGSWGDTFKVGFKQ
ncbi:MAG: hypothetical protein IKW67_02485 [Alphaproteobacteria bacterium]|nr:hypothetical protein [Alphaproteobacteria bacterium]